MNGRLERYAFNGKLEMKKVTSLAKMALLPTTETLQQSTMKTLNRIWQILKGLSVTCFKGKQRNVNLELQQYLP